MSREEAAKVQVRKGQVGCQAEESCALHLYCRTGEESTASEGPCGQEVRAGNPSGCQMDSGPEGSNELRPHPTS